VASTEDDVVVRLRLKDVKQFIADVKAGKLAIDDLEKKVKKAGQTASRESGASGGFGKLASHFGFLEGSRRPAPSPSVRRHGRGRRVRGEVRGEPRAGLGRVGDHARTPRQGRARMVANLQKFAKDTPFEFGTSKQAQQLLAFGFAAKSVIPTLTAVGNAASGLNLGRRAWTGSSPPSGR
jgi:hypothetical protein